MATVSCPGCEKKYSVPPGAGGRRVRCKACGAAITIPADPVTPAEATPVPVPVEPVPVIPLPAIPAEDPHAFPAVPPPLPPRQAPSVLSTPPPPSAVPVPNRFTPAVKIDPPSFSIGFQYRGWKLIPLIAGLVLTFLGTAQWVIFGRSTTDPRPITCKTLETVGCGSNHHVRLTDFAALNYLVRMQKDSPQMYELIPLVSPQDVTLKPGQRRVGKMVDVASVNPATICVLLKTTGVPVKGGASPVVNRPYIDGMVGGMFDTVPPGAATILRNKFPGIDTGKCIILEENAQPTGGLAIGVLSAGSLILIVAIGLLFLKYE